MGAMTIESSEEIRRLTQSIAQGDEASANELMQMVYAQLRAAAQRALASERPDHTLQATALVHEAYMRLAGPRDLPWQNRAHFYAAAAQAMRRILIDHARAKGARGGKHRRLTEFPDAAALILADPEEILAVEAAVVRLETEDPDAAAVVRLRFYAGLSVDQTAEALEISPRTCARLWSYARAVLYRSMEHQDEEQS